MGGSKNVNIRISDKVADLISRLQLVGYEIGETRLKTPRVRAVDVGAVRLQPLLFPLASKKLAVLGFT
jgi:hypothetical protein